MKPNILYVEDELDLGNVTKQYLELINFNIEWCRSGESALDVFSKAPNSYQLIIIDVQLIGTDGFELAEKIRQLNPNAYFLFLTARKEKSDRLKGLKIGAVDYITKPFDVDELVLRAQNIIRLQGVQIGNTKQTTGDLVYIGDICLDKNLLDLKLNDGQCINLTQRESELLEYLIGNQNKIIKREDILTKIWGENNYFHGRSLDVFISRLRKLLRSSFVKIDNVYGVGFIFSIKQDN